MGRVTLRLPDDLHKIAGEKAKLEDRPLNSFIIRAIRFYIDVDNAVEEGNKVTEENAFVARERIVRGKSKKAKQVED